MPSTSGLIGLIGVATAPVVLITATAILLSAYTAKYTAVSGTLRSLTAEYRLSQDRDRRSSLQRQVRLFQRRISALWAASVCLSLALLCFVGTVFTVIFISRKAMLGTWGADSLIVGLTLIAVAAGLEFHEILLARITVADEVMDVLQGD